MNKKNNSILKGIFALLISQILVKIIGLAYKLYLTNKDGFGDVGNAIYSSGFQIYALLLTLSSTGVPNALSKLISEKLAIGDAKGAHRIFKVSFFTFAFLGMLGCILLFYGAEYISNSLIQIPEAKYSLMFLAPSIFFVSITSVFRGYFNGMRDLSITAKSQTIEQILKTVFTIGFVEIISRIIYNDVVIMASVANLATTIATIFSFIYVYICYLSKKKVIKNMLKTSVGVNKVRIKDNFKNILNVAIPISLSSLMSSFNKNIDSFTIVRALKNIVTEEQAKIQYGILSGKVDILTLLPLSLNIPFITALVPEIAKANVKGNSKQVQEKSVFFILISIIIGMPTTFGMFFYSEQVLNLLFPNASSGVELLKLSSFTILFSLIVQTFNGILQGIGKEKVPMISFTVGMIVKFICNIVLLKYIGIQGAVIGNLLCNIVVCMIDYYELKNCIRLNLNIKVEIFKIIILTFIMIIISKMVYYNLISINSLKVATILSILVALLIYLIGLFVLKIIPKNIMIFKK